MFAHDLAVSKLAINSHLMICCYACIQIDINGRIIYHHLNCVDCNSNVFENYSLSDSGDYKRVFVVPFYANVDTYRVGRVYHRFSSNRNDPVVARAEKIIRNKCPIEQFRLDNFLLVTWDLVGYYRRHSAPVSH